MDMDDFIRSVIALCDAVKGKKHARKSIHLSFDEWNVCYHSGEEDNGKKPERWGRARPLSRMSITLRTPAHRLHPDHFPAPRRPGQNRLPGAAGQRNRADSYPDGGGCWAQTTYYPFQHMFPLCRGTSLLAAVDSPCYDCKDYEKVPYLDAAATRGEDGTVTVFCVNRHQEEDFTLDVDLHGMGALRLEEHICSTTTM
jgi:alpha-N-arabinofuranosidase